MIANIANYLVSVLDNLARSLPVLSGLEWVLILAILILIYWIIALIVGNRQ